MHLILSSSPNLWYKQWSGRSQWLIEKAIHKGTLKLTLIPCNVYCKPAMQQCFICASNYISDPKPWFQIKGYKWLKYEFSYCIKKKEAIIKCHAEDQYGTTAISSVLFLRIACGLQSVFARVGSSPMEHPTMNMVPGRNTMLPVLATWIFCPHGKQRTSMVPWTKLCLKQKRRKRNEQNV